MKGIKYCLGLFMIVFLVNTIGCAPPIRNDQFTRLQDELAAVRNSLYTTQQELASAKQSLADAQSKLQSIPKAQPVSYQPTTLQYTTAVEDTCCVPRRYSVVNTYYYQTRQYPVHHPVPPVPPVPSKPPVPHPHPPIPPPPMRPFPPFPPPPPHP